MSDDVIRRFEERLASQERELAGLRQERGSARRWRRLAGASCAAFGALVLMGQDGGRPREVGAERFVVRDASGAARAILGVNDGGVPSFSLLAPDGKTVRATLGLTGDGAGSSLTLSDARGTRRASLTVAATGVPALTINDGEGKNRVAVGVADNGVSFVALKDGAEKIRTFLYLNQDGSARLRFNDEKGQTVKELP